MKTFIDKLRETPIENLEQMIQRQKSEIKIAQRDLERMERVLEERKQ